MESADRNDQNAVDSSLLIEKINSSYRKILELENQASDEVIHAVENEKISETIRSVLSCTSGKADNGATLEPLSAYWRLRHVEQDVLLVKQMHSRNIISDPNGGLILILINFSLI